MNYTQECSFEHTSAKFCHTAGVQYKCVWKYENKEKIIIIISYEYKLVDSF